MLQQGAKVLGLQKLFNPVAVFICCSSTMARMDQNGEYISRTDKDGEFLFHVSVL